MGNHFFNLIKLLIYEYLSLIPSCLIIPWILFLGYYIFSKNKASHTLGKPYYIHSIN